MSTSTHEFDWNALLESAGPYPREAFEFVQMGLSHTQECRFEETVGLPEDERHVSGPELCIGLRDFAIDQYGMLAPSVLRSWHIERTDDFGRIVFAMVDHGLMSKTDEDSLDDFRGVFDFDEAFDRASLVEFIARG